MPFADTLPPHHGPERNRAILDAVNAGKGQIQWALVTASIPGHTAVFRVFADSLRIDGLRVNVSAALQQRILDRYKCLSLTPHLLDLMWAQREVTLHPFPQPITSDTSAMIAHSRKIDEALEALGNPPGLVSTVGKIWALTNTLVTKPGRAVNAGWHFEGNDFQGIKGEVNPSLLKDKRGQYVRMIQGPGSAHDYTHDDYSQILLGVHRECIVDNEPALTADVMTSRDLCGLISHEGPLKITRFPGIPDECLRVPFETVSRGPVEHPTVYDMLT